MGGTSTDVTHYAGAFERAFDTEVAGVRIRAPMMKIHTVAAGGGSIISFDGAALPGRARRVPAPIPGPACYRRGGPLAVTDANLMVGKLLPDFFPRVFGPAADQPLDAEVVRAAFAALAHEVARSTGVERTPEELAQGCLAIANDNMANAIKEISVQRGIDVTALRAVLLRRRRRRSTPARSPTCSASAASSSTPTPRSCRPTAWASPTLRVLRQQAVETAARRRRWSPSSMPRSRALPRRGRAAELQAQEVSEDARIAIEARVHVRYAGTDTSLEVPLADADAMRAAFEAEHRTRYGFVVEGRGLVVEAVTVEGIGAMDGGRRAGAGGPAARRACRWSRC